MLGVENPEPITTAESYEQNFTNEGGSDELCDLCREAEPFEAYLPQFYPGRGTNTFLGITQDGDGYFKFVAAEGENVDGPISPLATPTCA